MFSEIFCFIVICFKNTITSSINSSSFVNLDLYKISINLLYRPLGFKMTLITFNYCNII